MICSRRPGASSCPGSSASRRRSLSERLRARRVTTSPRPAANDGRLSANSGRAVARSRIGPVQRACSRSTMSTTCSLAQCRSSIRSTTGPWVASAERNWGQRRASSVATVSGRLRSSGLSASAIPAVVASAKTVASASADETPARVRRSPARSRTFSSASWRESSSEIPAAPRTTSAKGQYITALPTAGHRPRRTRRCGRSAAASAIASRTRRLFPIPAGP